MSLLPTDHQMPSEPTKAIRFARLQAEELVILLAKGFMYSRPYMKFPRKKLTFSIICGIIIVIVLGGLI